MERFVEDSSALTKSFFSVEPVAHLEEADVAGLCEISQKASGPARYNLHGSPADELHCMVILQPRRTYSQPRMHKLKAKSFHLIAGEMVVVSFKDDGGVATLHYLSAGKTLIVRIAPGIQHTNYSISEQAVYHEVIAGPYEPAADDRCYADFAPATEDQLSGQAWIEGIIESRQPGLFT